MTSPMTPRAMAVAEGYGLDPDNPGPDHIGWPDLLDRLSRERNWWVATVRPDGRPHVVPVWGLVRDGRPIFSSSPRARKAANMAHNPNIVVHLESGDDVGIFEGRVTKIEVADLPDGYAEGYSAKYDFEFDPTESTEDFGLYEVTITRAMAWNEAEFVDTVVVFDA
ncbi:MAG: pyridoxamine 5'-phosphate oxidase [Acidimicrobiales bacterium]|nr:pyridoxamine 5'-phosphate oxidase [Acidimicrobiales bacterium]